mmetsp:Transcript_651/g.872  ORF Transcript_651/g.872 Transcript_651/m.872 type:complete len:151 (+) Transcript_651:124-576(+)|eukprot:CAMPEP_0201551448 /NCGR_PEP_ID=MMETSP0173_2-20130828/7616_1 /ASSEMBLY_ACC=CAM_ASM_000268 /TAXON_ID=218659 /ORGANISM="Vexillifera sp., Strain DIVA3 564/2" /LENGTH=150 /DNA_ID=CAMNT_0047961705 /DNA_START=73 /DNA_END=525 /DNA_ORIENTATION=+
MARRVAKEYKKLTDNTPSWLKVTLPDENDLYKWVVTVQGPDGSPYAKGKFDISVELPADYPFKHPKFNFKTKIYHPNVKTDSGEMCDQWLKEMWSPQLTIEKVLELLRNQFLAEPKFDEPLESSIAEQYKKSKSKFDKTAEEWVKKYASK